MKPRCLLMALMPEGHLLPYTTDERHVEDTLFFVFEEDFMLFKDEEVQQPARQLAESERFLSPSAGNSTTEGMIRVTEGAETPSEVVVDLGAEWASRIEVDSQVKVDLMAAMGVEPRPAAHFHTRMSKPTAKTVGSNSEHIDNMVRAVTQAHRVGKGDIVWMTWDEDANKKKRGSPSPQHASTLIAMSTRGARWVVDHLSEMACWQ